MQQEIARLTQQLELTRMQLPQAVHQQVGAAHAQHSAQLSMLASGLNQVHQLAQHANATAARALAAPVLAAPAVGLADDSMQQEESPRSSSTANPHLPPYSGSEDPGLWAFQVDALFQANRTPPAQQGLWMAAALRGQAMRFWHLECAGLPAEPKTILEKLKTRFRPYAHEFGLFAQLQKLEMQPGNYLTFADRFLEISSQLPHLAEKTRMFTFLSGITDAYRQHCLMYGTNSLAEVMESCRRLDLSSRTTSSVKQPALVYAQRDRLRRPHSDSRSRSPHFRGARTSSPYKRFSKSPRREGSFTPRSDSSRSRSTSARSRSPFRPQSRSPGKPCYNCGKPGHFAKDCRGTKRVHYEGNPSPRAVPPTSPKPSPGGFRGRGRGYGSFSRGRGSDRGRRGNPQR